MISTADRLVPVSWPAKEPSFSASVIQGLTFVASAALIDGMLRALVMAPVSR